MTNPNVTHIPYNQDDVCHDDFAVNGTGSPMEAARFEEALLDRLDAQKAAALAIEQTAAFEGVVHHVDFGAGFVATRELAQVA